MQYYYNNQNEIETKKKTILVALLIRNTYQVQ